MSAWGGPAFLEQTSLFYRYCFNMFAFYLQSGSLHVTMIYVTTRIVASLTYTEAYVQSCTL